MTDAKRPDIVRDALGSNPAPGAQEAWLADATDCLQRNGVVVLRNAIPPAAIAAARAAFKGRRFAADQHDERRFQPAPLRPRIPVPLEGPFADPQVFAPPSALALARRLLGEELIVGELGAVISRPGDGAQETRRTAIPLFGSLKVEGDVPPAALTMLAPLEAVGPGVGFPEYWLGSHRTGAAKDAPVQTALEAGSVVISDWRTLYRAELNISGAEQLGLYVSFRRKWLISLSGSEYKSGLDVPPATMKSLPKAYHPLVAWALHQNKTDDVSEFLHLWLGRSLKRLSALRSV
jgi:hypothetical protein